MSWIIENGKTFWYDEKLDTRIEYGKYIPSVIKLPLPIPEYQKTNNCTKDLTMKTTVSEINFDLFNEFINAELNPSVNLKQLDKFKPIKQDGYEIIYVKDELEAYHYGMDYLKGEYLFKTDKNKPINYQKRLEKTIFIHALTRKPITWLDELLKEAHKPENKVILTGDGIKDHITKLVREDNMTDEQIIALLRYEINECIKLTKEFYGVINKPEISDTKSDILDFTKPFDIGNVEQLITEGFLVPNMIAKGELIELVAAPKVGKTLFAQDLIASLVLGEDFLGYEIKEDNRRVLYIQLDESETTANIRFCQRLGVNKHEDIRTLNEWKLDDDGIKTLDYLLEKYKFQLVVIDSLRAALIDTGIDENSATIKSPLIKTRNILRKHNATGFLIHHSNKNKENKGVDKSAGSHAIASSCWSTWTLTPAKDDVITLRTKGRHADVKFDLILDSDTLHFTVTESEDGDSSQEIVDDLPITQKIMLQIPEWIKDGKDTVVLMNDGNDYNRSTLKKALNELVKSGVIVRIGNGKNKPSSYELVSDTENELTVSPESITEISPEYHQQYQHETHDLQPSQENITTGDTESVTPTPTEYHQEYHQKISPDIELEKTNAETRENQQDNQSLQLTGELKTALDKLKQHFSDGKETDYDFYIHTRLFSNMIFENVVIMLDQLVELGHLSNPYPSEYGLAF